MRRVSKSKVDEQWLKALGLHVATLIQKRGYASPYEFWIECAGDHLSRSALNYILSGKKDAKATTLRTLAQLLEVSPSELLKF